MNKLFTHLTRGARLLTAMCLLAVSMLVTAITPTESHAQAAMTQSATGLVGSQTAYLTTSTRGYYKQLALECQVTKTAGAPAATIVIQGSLDGTTYHNLYRNTTQKDLPGSDSLTVTNTAGIKSYTYEVSPVYWKYYRLAITSTSASQGFSITGLAYPLTNPY